jgi:hypothetical protein
LLCTEHTELVPIPKSTVYSYYKHSYFISNPSLFTGLTVFKNPVIVKTTPCTDKTSQEKCGQENKRHKKKMVLK